MVKWMIVIMLAVFAFGCIKSIDPNTGNSTYVIDPNTGQAIQVGLDTVTTVTGASSLIFPQYAAIFALIGGVIGYIANLFRKLNPVLSKSMTKDEIQQQVITAIAVAIKNIADSALQTKVKENVATNLKILEIPELGKSIISEAKTSYTAEYLDTVVKPVTEPPK